MCSYFIAGTPAICPDDRRRRLAGGWARQDDDSIGVSDFDVPQLRRAQRIATVETLQPR